MVHAGENHSLLACTSKCGWGITIVKIKSPGKLLPALNRAVVIDELPVGFYENFGLLPKVISQSYTMKCSVRHQDWHSLLT
jgi:hypothetical protein